MTQADIATECQKNHQGRIKTQHGWLCVDCWSAYRDARPKRTRRPRQAITAYGDYAIFAAINRGLRK